MHTAPCTSCQCLLAASVSVLGRLSHGNSNCDASGGWGGGGGGGGGGSSDAAHLELRAGNWRRAVCGEVPHGTCTGLPHRHRHRDMHWQMWETPGHRAALRHICMICSWRVPDPALPSLFAGRPGSESRLPARHRDWGMLGQPATQHPVVAVAVAGAAVVVAQGRYIHSSGSAPTCCPHHASPRPAGEWGWWGAFKLCARRGLGRPVWWRVTVTVCGCVVCMPAWGVRAKGPVPVKNIQFRQTLNS